MILWAGIGAAESTGGHVRSPQNVQEFARKARDGPAQLTSLSGLSNFKIVVVGGRHV